MEHMEHEGPLPPIPTIDVVIDYWNKQPNIKNKTSFPTKSRITEFTTSAAKPIFRANWKQAIDKLNASKFATGRQPSRSGEYWNVTFRFILVEDNLQKIMDGEYDTAEKKDRIGIDIA